ncbi:ribbon-helix-helix domain-containing protein [Aulosira sp. FACHB-615]|uniref:ribbon-helix-helix domain-containing protein n=1 Tax=Aulosira sp. FACHB-615 TaxID=2692777 RepID=UPI001689117B|nr:ribbon-helix-helix domain-containing protein [Aulosira sp. FACHB-615]MBD2488982.1 ribbon-helix-helix domain-containing protein [Aulosira sp. FACHB-615]
MKNPKSFRFPPDIDEKLREESERTGIPQTGIIIAALKKWFDYEDVTYSVKLPNGKTIATVTANGTDD